MSRSGLRLHLSEHHRDGSPGAAVHVALRGVRELHAELDAKAYPYLNPRITRTPFGFALDVIDPFGNQLSFGGTGCQRAPFGFRDRIKADLVASLEQKNRISLERKWYSGRAPDQMPAAWTFDTANRGLGPADAD